MSGYVQLAQRPTEELEQTASAFEKEQDQTIDQLHGVVAQTPTWFDLRVSPLVVYLFLAVAVMVNLGCILKTTWAISTVFDGMDGRGEIFTDTRDLPRGNIYDGLLVR